MLTTIAIIVAAVIVLGIAAYAGVLLWALVKMYESEGFELDNADYQEDKDDKNVHNNNRTV